MWRGDHLSPLDRAFDTYVYRKAKLLEQFGLGENAERIYLTLLSHQDADLASMAQVSGLSENEIRTALSVLADKALVYWNSHTANPQLIDPGIALPALVARQESEIAARKHELEQSRIAISRLLAARESADGADLEFGIERYDDLTAVRQMIEKFSSTCREEVWSFNPGGPQTQDNLVSSRPANEDTLRRGVRMRAIYLDSVRNDPPSAEHIEWLVGLGAEVRTVMTLPIRMLIVDKQTAVLPIDDRDSSRGALVVSGRGMIAGLVALFTTTWLSARPFGPRETRPTPDEPNNQEYQALRLWAQGATDAAVARALGVSERTVRRMSDALAKRLGSSSRFETAARAMDLGWLTSKDLI